MKFFDIKQSVFFLMLGSFFIMGLFFMNKYNKIDYEKKRTFFDNHISIEKIEVDTSFTVKDLNDYRGTVFINNKYRSSKRYALIDSSDSKLLDELLKSGDTITIQGDTITIINGNDVVRLWNKKTSR